VKTDSQPLNTVEVFWSIGIG